MSSSAKPRVSGDRALVFAQAALSKRLVTRQQAEECVKIARKLKKANKPLPIEQVFVRKGYLRKAEAAAIVKRIRPKGAPQPLALVPEQKPRGRERCGSCGKDPGDEADCYHCGADRETGGPGPRATVCESCSGVVLRGSAICFHCGQTMRSRGRRRAKGGSGALDRLIVLATILGVGYFLIYRNLVAPPSAPAAEALPAAPSQDPALEAALAKAAELAEEDRAGAAAVLQEALGKAAPGDQARVQRALAFVAEGPSAQKAAEAALSAGEDPLLRRRLAELAWGREELKATKAQVLEIPAELRGDRDWRLLAAAERALGGDWTPALLQIRKPTASERAPLAAALWQRGLEHLGVKRLEQATHDLERAVELDPKRSTLHASLGAAYLQGGKHAEAKTAYQAAIRTEPRPTHYIGLALAQEGLNERAAAIRSYESFLQITQGVPEHAAQQKKVRARLERLRAPAATPTPN